MLNSSLRNVRLGLRRKCPTLKWENATRSVYRSPSKEQIGGRGRYIFIASWRAETCECRDVTRLTKSKVPYLDCRLIKRKQCRSVKCNVRCTAVYRQVADKADTLSSVSRPPGHLIPNTLIYSHMRAADIFMTCSELFWQTALWREQHGWSVVSLWLQVRPREGVQGGDRGAVHHSGEHRVRGHPRGPVQEHPEESPSHAAETQTCGGLPGPGGRPLTSSYRGLSWNAPWTDTRIIYNIYTLLTSRNNSTWGLTGDYSIHMMEDLGSQGTPPWWTDGLDHGSD